MMRMFMIQGAIEFASKSGKLTTRGKVVIVLLISSFFIGGDMMSFTNSRGDNIYKQVGLTRAATQDQIEHAWQQY